MGTASPPGTPAPGQLRAVAGVAPSSGTFWTALRTCLGLRMRCPRWKCARGRRCSFPVPSETCSRADSVANVPRAALRGGISWGWQGCREALPASLGSAFPPRSPLCWSLFSSSGPCSGPTAPRASSPDPPPGPTRVLSHPGDAVHHLSHRPLLANPLRSQASLSSALCWTLLLRSLVASRQAGQGPRARVQSQVLGASRTPRCLHGVPGVAAAPRQRSLGG